MLSTSTAAGEAALGTLKAGDNNLNKRKNSCNNTHVQYILRIVRGCDVIRQNVKELNEKKQ